YFPPRLPGRQRSTTRVESWGPGLRFDPRRHAMPFTYKLACRLARLKHLVVGAAAVVAATIMLSCEVPIRSTAPEATVDQLIILPDVVTLQLNQDQDFMAVGLNAAGDTTPSPVTWTVTGGKPSALGSRRGPPD